MIVKIQQHFPSNKIQQERCYKRPSYTYPRCCITDTAMQFYYDFYDAAKLVTPHVIRGYQLLFLRGTTINCQYIKYFAAMKSSVIEYRTETFSTIIHNHMRAYTCHRTIQTSGSNKNLHPAKTIYYIIIISVFENVF